jgi:hypothetical protein
MQRRPPWDRVRDRELKHLAQADREIAHLNKRIARQKLIIQAAIVNGRASVEAESLLRALDACRRAFEMHRQLIVSLLENAGIPPRSE